MKNETGLGFGLGSAFSLFGIGFVLFGMWGCPQYAIYSKRLDGQAQLAQSDASKQVQINDARGKLDAAKLLAAAEVERAKGASQANEILMERLGGPEGYLRYLYIQGMEHRAGDTIYIPTEAGLPILEANRRQK